MFLPSCNCFISSVASDPPYQVEVFQDMLYVTTYKKRKVLKLPKFYSKSKDKDPETLTESIMHIEDIVIVQESKQMIKNLAGKCVIV